MYFWVYIGYIWVFWSHIVNTFPLLAVQQEGDNDQRFSHEKSLQIITTGISTLLDQFTSWQTNINDQEDLSQQYLSEDLVFVIQDIQSFGDHIDQCLVEGGYILSNPHLLLNSPYTLPQSILIATYDTEQLLSQTPERQVEIIGEESNGCLLSVYDSGLHSFESSVVQCSNHQAQAVCLYHSPIARSQQQANSFIKNNFVYLAKSATDNLQIIRTNISHLKVHIDDFGTTIKAALGLAGRIEPQTQSAPLTMQVFHNMYLLNQYISEMVLFLYQEHLDALTQRTFAWDAMNDKISQQVHLSQTNQQNWDVQIQHLKTKFSKLKKLQSNKFLHLEQMLQRILRVNATNSPQSPDLGGTSAPSSPQPHIISGSGGSDDSNIDSDSNVFEEQSGWSDDFETPHNCTETTLPCTEAGHLVTMSPNVTVWPFTYSIALEDYYRLSFLNFYAATFYACVTAILTTITTVHSCVRNKRVKKLKKTVQQIKNNQARRARPPKAGPRRQRTQQGQQPLLPVPERHELMRVISSQ